MYSNTYADSAQVAILVAALDGFCDEKGIAVDSPDRERIASVIWALFENGVRTRQQFEAELARLKWPQER